MPINDKHPRIPDEWFFAYNQEIEKWRNGWKMQYNDAGVLYYVSMVMMVLRQGGFCNHYDSLQRAIL